MLPWVLQQANDRSKENTSILDTTRALTNYPVKRSLSHCHPHLGDWFRVGHSRVQER